MRYCLGREGDIGPLGDGRLKVELPALHDGPIGIELVAQDRDSLPFPRRPGAPWIRHTVPGT